jgi:hypothetical protein
LERLAGNAQEQNALVSEQDDQDSGSASFQSLSTAQSFLTQAQLRSPRNRPQRISSRRIIPGAGIGSDALQGNTKAPYELLSLTC